ncbi:MAG: hypothetical protein QOI59_389 [Gammaproteobacteria bacterium]|nr:hypothetical protein [Gammaproteobacteria bacterium]
MSALHTPFRGGLLKGMSGLPLYSGGRLFDDVAKYRAIRVAAAGGYRVTAILLRYPSERNALSGE